MPPNPLGLVASFLSCAHHWDNLEAARRFGRPVVLAPASMTDAPPAIALPGEFDRVIRPHPESSFAIERQRIRPGRHDHPATIAYVVEDAVLYRGALIRVGPHYVGPRGKRLRGVVAPAQAVAKALLCSDFVIAKYFGHWMHDGLPLELLAQDLGLPAITSAAREWVHGPGYHALAGTAPVALEAARFGELWLVDDRGLNAGRIERVQRLREAVRRTGRPHDASPRKVFLMRGSSGAARQLENEAEVEAALIAAGFAVLHPEQSSVEHIARTLKQAELIVAVEGSAQSHYLLCGPAHGKVLSIQPPQQFNAIFKTFFDAIGMRWGYVVADPAGETSFSLPVARLRQALDLLENA